MGQFDVNKVLDQLSEDNAELANILRRRTGVDVSIGAVQKWRARNSIPGQKLLGVLYAIQLTTPKSHFDFYEYRL